MEPTDVSDRSRGVALCLGISLGVFGAHRFYTGKVLTGILQAGTIGGLGLWWLYDMILLAAGEFRDVDEKRVRSWGSSPRVPRRSESAPRWRGSCTSSTGCARRWESWVSAWTSWSAC
jgi:hypothetical protein